MNQESTTHGNKASNIGLYLLANPHKKKMDQEEIQNVKSPPVYNFGVR